LRLEGLDSFIFSQMILSFFARQTSLNGGISSKCCKSMRGPQVNSWTWPRLLFSSAKTRPDFRSFIRTSSGVSISTGFEKYLDLPALVGRSKYRTFAGICDCEKKSWMAERKSFSPKRVKKFLSRR